MADEVFVGRRDEQARFAALLRELAAAGGARKGRWPVRRSSGDHGDAGAACSRVVLVHGLGGSGKSSLLRQFRAMATGAVPSVPMAAGELRCGWLDWEDEAGQDPGRYAGAAGPSLVTVLDAVQQAVTGAFADNGRVVQAFGEYRTGAARMPEYIARFQDVAGQAGRQGSTFTSQDAVALVRTAISAGLAAGGHPGGVLGLGPDQLAAATQSGGHLSEAVVQAVTGRKRGDISAPEYDLVTDPVRELIRRAAAAVRVAAGIRPLVVFLDTGEVIGDRAWGWLRRMMTRTGPRVAWVVGARFETEAEAGADSPVAWFVREIGDGHLLLMSPTRFDDSLLRAYLESRPGAQDLTGGQIGLVARFTRGLPLAVSFTATLLGGGQAVEEACRDIDDGQPSTVISQLARRYLVHAEAQDVSPPGDPRRDDVVKILALALAYGNLRDDPALLAALWDTSDPLATFQELARRHDFVLPVSRRLHDEVRDTLRTDLLDPYRRHRVRPVNERALTLFIGRLARMRDRWPNLDQQLEHAEFTTALLGALWHTTWISNQDGLDLLTAILPVLAATDPRNADAAAAISGQFAGTYTPDQERDLDQLTRDESDLFEDFPDDMPPRRSGKASRRAMISLDGLALGRSCLAEEMPLLGQPGDQIAALHILSARLQMADHQAETAVASLRAAAVPTRSTRLHQAIGTQALAIADQFIWDGLWDGAARADAAVRTDIALAAAEIATETLPGRASAWRSRGTILRQAGRFKEALAADDQVLALDPSSPDTHLNRAYALVELGRFEEALAADDQVLALDPSNAGAHHNKGNALLRAGRIEEALAAYDQVLVLDPSNAGAHNNKGNALMELGRFGEALAAYDQVLALDPSNASAHDNMGNALLRAGWFERAPNAYAHNNRGNALMELGRIGEALAAYDQVLALDPSNAGAHNNRGNALMELGRIGEALAAYDQVLALDPSNAGAHNNKGNALLRAGRIEEALAAYDQILALDPTDAGAHNNRGNALTELGRIEEALAAYDQVLALDPTDAGAHNNKGNALLRAGRIEEALAAYDQILALDPSNAGAHNNRGNALTELGRIGEALAAYDQVQALDHSNRFTYYNRGIALERTGRFEEALAAYDQALALDHSNGFAHNNRGNTLLMMGRFEEALAAYGQALAIDPANAGRHENKGIALAVTGDLDQALAEFDTADRLDPVGGGKGKAWAGAIFWHRRETLTARDRFARVNGQVKGGTAFQIAELEAIALCGLGQPDNAEQHLLRAMSHRACGYRIELRTIYDLLADPPLLGIDRLRTIIDNDAV